MNDNRGLSLMELIAVIAIMAVLTSFLAMGVSAIFGMDAKECASALNGYMKETKNSALSKDDQEIKIYKDVDGKYYVDFVVYQYEDDLSSPGAPPSLVPNAVETECIGKSSVTIVCRFSGSHTITIGALSDSVTPDSVTLGFDRASGAFKTAKINDSNTTLYCEEITVSKGSKSFTIEMIPKTGKHSLK